MPRQEAALLFTAVHLRDKGGPGKQRLANCGLKSMLVNREVQLGLGGEGPSLYRLGHYSSQRW